MIHTLTNSYSMQLGGAEKLALQLHRELLKNGHEARLCGLYSNASDEPSAVDIGAKRPYSWRAVLGLARYCRTIGRNDLVHVHLFPTIFYCALFQRLGWLRGKLIFTEHNTHNNRRGTRWGRILDNWMYRRIHTVVAISEGTRASLIEWLPQIEGRCVVIRNGVVLRNASYTPREAKGVVQLVSVGNLKTQKNYIAAVEAVGNLRDLPFVWSIAGEGPLRAALEQRIAELGLTDKIRLLGHVDNVPALLSASDAFFLPSLWEGFGLAVVEAMDASLPLVVSAISGMNEVAGQAALTFDPRSTASIADSVRTIVQEAALRDQLGRDAFEHSRAFGFDSMFQNYQSLYTR